MLYVMGCKGYFKSGNYSNSTVDVIIITTANALHLNMSIYKQGPDGNLQLIEQTSDNKGRDVHLKFTHDPQNLTHNHYAAILLHPKSSLLSFSGKEQACDKGEDDVGQHSLTTNR